MEPRDVEAILEIQCTCPEIAQWTMWDYERATRGEMPGWVAEDASDRAGRVAGFLVARRVASDIEILNLAVSAEFRRKGIGATLLRAAIEWAKSIDAEKAFLEVRTSNNAALRFYEKFEFRATGRRPRYYSGPIEDALLLAADLTQRNAGSSAASD
jgi:ribosomal-protein-alanine N-acetyltransferase